MVDIFVSYESSDRPRAEVLRSLFADFGWTVWIDREIPVGEDWDAHIDKELNAARLIVVLWGAQARRSEWVKREASVALKTNRLLQIHATGLPLLPPFDAVQAVRMQSWSGESAHSEHQRLITISQLLSSCPFTIAPGSSNAAASRKAAN
jgi:adenylate cyclase